MLAEYEKMCMGSRILKAAGEMDLRTHDSYHYADRHYLVKERTGWQKITIIQVAATRVKYVADDSFFNITRESWSRKLRVWLPSQDELQGMIDRTAQVTLNKLEDSHPELKEIMVTWRKKYLLGKTGWRELWLRVYMLLSHDKTWDGECWQ